MAKKVESLRGMEDILPGEVEKWQWLEEQARIFFEARGYKEIRTPLIEYTDLFVRSVGETSDIVHKEMFSFEDRGGRNVTLRPEMTASVARAVIEKGLLKQAKSLRLYYLGAMFRAERPQAGRKRQFHQIGAELVNESGRSADFESISLVYGFLKFAGISKPNLKLNDLGTAETKSQVAEKLRDYFQGAKAKLCKDCQWRLDKNVLRIFDCKTESCQPVIEKTPWDKIAPLSRGFQELTEQLKTHDIPYTIHRRLVRGLDYYNGAVFELTCEGLGAQDAVAGGGRYDRLYAELGGQEIPCTGFSIGVERLLAALDQEKSSVDQKLRNRKVYIAALDSNCKLLSQAHEMALNLRGRGIRIEATPGETSLSKHLKKANKLNLRYALILGPEELEKGIWVLKDLDQQKQSEIKKEDLPSFFLGAGAC